MALASRSAILDPFAGNGTVGLAARELGLPFYLIDNDPACKEMWKERAAHPPPAMVEDLSRLS